MCLQQVRTLALLPTLDSVERRRPSFTVSHKKTSWSRCEMLILVLETPNSLESTSFRCPLYHVRFDTMAQKVPWTFPNQNVSLKHVSAIVRSMSTADCNQGSLQQPVMSLSMSFALTRCKFLNKIFDFVKSRWQNSSIGCAEFHLFNTAISLLERWRHRDWLYGNRLH